MNTVTELEQWLATDAPGNTLRALLGQLALAAAEFSRAQRAPLAPADYARCERQRHSCLAAMRTIEQLWQRQHAGRSQFR